MKKYSLAIIIALTQINISVSAAETNTPIIVTATRTAQTVDETLASVTVITREQIEQQQATSIPDVLRGVAGISITNNGGPGKATSLFLRGADSDHTLVLIDGLRVGSATLGTTALQDIPIDQIDRIEIVRGPRSGLYGSEAIGGVIQIFTRKGGGKLRPSFSYQLGSYDTYKMDVGLSGGGNKAWYNFNASSLDTEGFNSCRGSASAGCFTVEPDKDGYTQGSVSLRSGYRFDSGLELDLKWLRSESDTEFDGSFQNESSNVQNIISGTVNFNVSDAWNLNIQMGQSRDESDNFLSGAPASQFTTKRDSASVQNNLTLSKDRLLTFGLDFYDDNITSTTNYDITSRDNTGLFGQYQLKLGSHDVLFNLRNDDNEQFGSRTTSGIAWGFTSKDKLRYTASYGSAFKAPSINELAFPGFGNPNLKPEESETLEAGINKKVSWGKWAVNVFHTEVDELIGFDTSFNPVNIDKATINGVESTLNIQFSSWTISSSLTLLDPINDAAGSNNGKVLNRRAKEIFNLDIQHDLGKFDYGMTLHAEGKRYDDLANTQKLAGYATLDLRAEYELEKDWRIQAKINNVFDKQYETARYYNQAGASLYLTLLYRPQ